MSLSRKVYAPLPPYADERRFADACCDELAPYFHIEREVPFTHWTEVTLIVDAVMGPAIRRPPGRARRCAHRSSDDRIRGQRSQGVPLNRGSPKGRLDQMTKRGSGEESIRQRPNGTWEARISYVDPATRQRRSHSVYAATAELARDKLDEARDRIKEQAPVRDSTQTVAD